jgi:sodium-dependent dicarboxylate transporter 2/3/5
MSDSQTEGSVNYWRLSLGPIAALIILLAPTPDGLSDEAWRTLAIAVWMAIWWVTEAIPIFATALLPLALFPLLGVTDIRGAAAPFANPLVFLFLGGFLIAAAMQKCNLHRRIALNIAMRVGSGPSRLIGGFMIASAFLSMWISNTATTMMMMPIAASVIAVVVGGNHEKEGGATPFGAALMLGIAYAASIGGVATLVGTPPNAFLSGFFEETYGYDIGFARWMMIGLPVTMILLPACWLVLTRIMNAAGGARPADEHGDARAVLGLARDALGPMSVAEKRVAVVFVATALLWITRPLASTVPGLSALSDPGIAMLAGIVLFVAPSGKAGKALLSWEDTRGVPWGVLILFGGGLSLASAISKSGLAAWLGGIMGGASILPALLFIGAIVAIIIFLTELTSNLATTAAFIPIVAAMADGLGLAPISLTAPAALAASCAFMLPVATPPNAIVYGSGQLTVAQMVRAGFVMNLIAIGLLTLVGHLLIPILFD